LTLNPQSGTVEPQGSQEVEVKISATELSFGNYEAMLSINSNDPNKPVVNVFVGLTVTINSFDLLMNAGWNLIGLPLRLRDANYLSIFPNSLQNSLFSWNGSSYTMEESMEPGNGYWISFPEPDTVSINGSEMDSLTIRLTAGWNLISGISYAIALDNVQDPENIIIPGTLYGYNDAYYLADSIKMGNGYWLLAEKEGQIILSCDSSSAGQLFKNYATMPDLLDCNALLISDAKGANRKLYFDVKIDNQDLMTNFRLPPIPPMGSFDARFSNGCLLSDREEDGVIIQTCHLPITILAQNLSYNKDFEYVIRNVSGDERENQVLKQGDLVKFYDSEKLVLKVSKQQKVPTVFRVEQNYPNPFNPITEIKYSLPQPGNVEITVYNTLGEKVKTIISEFQKAGIHKVTWDATDMNNVKVGSGIYYYIVKTNNDRCVKKMLYLK